MGVPSLTRQVVWCFQALERFGESRHLAKAAGTAGEGLHGRVTEKNYLASAVAFARWAGRQHGVRLLIELQEHMGAEYIGLLIEEGKVPRTIKTVAAALRKLQVGIKKRFGRDVKVLPDDFKTPRAGLDQRVRAHIYTPEEACAILQELEGEVALVVSVQLLTGLRISEALSLRREMVDLERRTVTVKGKGGRVRSVPLDRPGALDFFRRLVDGMPEGRRIFTVSPRTVQSRVRAACLKHGIECGGTHGFRRAYACSLLGDLLLRGFDAKSSKRTVSHNLGHNRLSVVSHYLPRPGVKT